MRRRTAVIAAGTFVVLGILALAGWQVGWPPGVFGGDTGPLAWSAARAPLPPDAVTGSKQRASLEGLDCPDQGDCVAVGWYVGGGPGGLAEKGLIETLSGGTWHAAAASGLTGVNPKALAVLTAVSCPSLDSCVAVGYRDGGDGLKVPVSETLAQGRWNLGTPAVPAGAEEGTVTMNGVSCPVLGTCVATGQYSDSRGYAHGVLDTLVNGKWLAVRAPEPASAKIPAVGAPGVSESFTYLTGVDCAAGDACVVTGQYTPDARAYHPFADTLSSGIWTAAALPFPADASPTAQLAGLWSVSCRAGGDCLAGGQYVARGGQYRFLIETLSGGRWTASAVPGVPADAAAKQTKANAATTAGVACRAAGSCLSTMTYMARGGGFGAAIATGAGATWQLAGAPSPADAAAGAKRSSYPGRISCPAVGSCYMAGVYTAADGSGQGLLVTGR